MRTLLILALTAASLPAQAPPAPGGRGGGGRGPSYNGPPEAVSVPYPGTVAAVEATEKLLAAVKAAPRPDPKLSKKPSAQTDEAALEAQLRATLDPPPPPPAANANPNAPPPVPHLKAGNAAAGEHGEFVFAIETDRQPQIEITNIKTTLPPAKAWPVGKLWVYETSLPTGSAYSFNWTVDGKSIGGGNDLPAFTQDAYPKAGVPQG